MPRDVSELEVQAAFNAFKSWLTEGPDRLSFLRLTAEARHGCYGNQSCTARTMELIQDVLAEILVQRPGGSSGLIEQLADDLAIDEVDLQSITLERNQERV